MPQIVESDHSEVCEISYSEHNDDAVKPSSPVQNINRPVLQSWEGDEYLEHEVAAHGRIRSDDSDEEMIPTTQNIDRGGKAKGKRDCNPNSRNDYKRKQFSDWLQSQPDAHDDWGFTSTGCTPVCLSRCSSAVDIVTADGQSAGK
ncbi:hypothetical protein D6D11_08382 [Aureobasidium pullulans]|nr:hypothetical protein D6D11_08382 [Aureobasidium pullulans]